jgi:hypothetical protein
MIRQSAPLQVAMVAYSCAGVSRVTIRLQFARIAEWQGPVVRVHLISPWPAHLGDHAGHCIHHHRQQATDYLFADLPGFKKPTSRGSGVVRSDHTGWSEWLRRRLVTSDGLACHRTTVGESVRPLRNRGVGKTSDGS